MNIKELRVLNSQELLLRVQELKHEGILLRFRKANGHLEKTHLIRKYRKEIARCLTLISERQHK